MPATVSMFAVILFKSQTSSEYSLFPVDNSIDLIVVAELITENIAAPQVKVVELSVVVDKLSADEPILVADMSSAV